MGETFDRYEKALALVILVKKMAVKLGPVSTILREKGMYGSMSVILGLTKFW